MELGITNNAATTRFAPIRPSHVIVTTVGANKLGSELNEICDYLSTFVSAVLGGWNDRDCFDNSFLRAQGFRKPLEKVMRAKTAYRRGQNKDGNSAAGLTATSQDRDTQTSVRARSLFAFTRTKYQLREDGLALLNVIRKKATSNGPSLWDELAPEQAFLRDVLTSTAAEDETTQVESSGKPRKKSSNGKSSVDGSPTEKDSLVELASHALVWFSDARLTLDPAPRDNVRATSEPLGKTSAVYYREDVLLENLRMLDHTVLPFDGARGYGGAHIRSLDGLSAVIRLTHGRSLTKRGGLYDHAAPNWHKEFDIHQIQAEEEVASAKREAAALEKKSISAVAQPNVAKLITESVPAAWTAAWMRSAYRRASNGTMVARLGTQWFPSIAIDDLVETAIDCLLPICETLGAEGAVVNHLIEQERVAQYGKVISNVGMWFTHQTVRDDYISQYCNPLYAETRHLPLVPGAYADRILLPDTVAHCLPLFTIVDQDERLLKLGEYQNKLASRRNSQYITQIMADDQARLISNPLSTTLKYDELDMELITTEAILAAAEADSIQVSVEVKPLGADLDGRLQATSTDVLLWLADPIVRQRAMFPKAQDAWGRTQVIAGQDSGGHKDLIFEIKTSERGDAQFTFTKVAAAMNRVIDRISVFHMGDHLSNKKYAMWELKYLRDGYEFIHGLRQEPHLLNGVDMTVQSLLGEIGLYWFIMGLDYRGVLSLPIHIDEGGDSHERCVSSTLGSLAEFGQVPVDRLVTMVADSASRHIRAYLAKHVDMVPHIDVPDDELLSIDGISNNNLLLNTVKRFQARNDAWASDMIWNRTRMLSFTEIADFVNDHVADPFYFFNTKTDTVPLIASNDVVPSNPLRLPKALATPLVAEDTRRGERFASSSSVLPHLAPITACGDLLYNYYVPSAQGSFALFSLLSFLGKPHVELENTSIIANSYLIKELGILEDVGLAGVEAFSQRNQDADGGYLRSKARVLKQILTKEVSVDDIQKQGHSRVSLAEAMTVMVLSLMVPERIALSLMKEGDWSHGTGDKILSNGKTNHLALTSHEGSYHESYDRLLYANPVKPLNVVSVRPRFAPFYRNSAGENGSTMDHAETKRKTNAWLNEACTNMEVLGSTLRSESPPSEEVLLDQLLALRDMLSIYFTRVLLKPEFIVPQMVRDRQERVAAMEVSGVSGAGVTQTFSKADDVEREVQSVTQSILSTSKLSNTLNDIESLNEEEFDATVLILMAQLEIDRETAVKLVEAGMVSPSVIKTNLTSQSVTFWEDPSTNERAIVQLIEKATVFLLNSENPAKL